MRVQAKLAGQDGLKFDLPRGLLKDEAGVDLAEQGLAASDVVALLVGVGAASADVWCGHSNFTLNNLLACLIAVDLLGVQPPLMSTVCRLRVVEMLLDLQ